MRSLRLSGALAWWLAAGPSLAQYDPLNDFCRRWGHQSAVVDRKLYIDGGLVNYKPFTAESQNISSETTSPRRVAAAGSFRRTDPGARHVPRLQ